MMFSHMPTSLVMSMLDSNEISSILLMFSNMFYLIFHFPSYFLHTYITSICFLFTRYFPNTFSSFLFSLLQHSTSPLSFLLTLSHSLFTSYFLFTLSYFLFTPYYFLFTPPYLLFTPHYFLFLLSSLTRTSLCPLPVTLCLSLSPFSFSSLQFTFSSSLFTAPIFSFTPLLQP